MLRLFKSSLSFLITGTGLLVLAATAMVLIDHYWNRQLYIDAIASPEALKLKYDLSETVIAQRLKDELDYIAGNGWSSRTAQGTAFFWDQPDLEVPGTPYTLRDMKRLIGAFLNLPGRRLSGEVSRADDKFLLRLRLDGRVVSRDREIKSEDLTQSLRVVAQDVLRTVDPFTLAAYYKAQGDNEHALALIRHCLREEPEEDDAWAYNLWGVIQTEAMNIVDAERSYKAAIFVDPNFTPAYLNLAPMLAEQGKFDEAHRLFWRLRATAEVDAGFYVRWADVHARRAQALVEGRHEVAPNLAGSLQSAAARHYERARELYEEALALEPGHAIARVGMSRLHLAQVSEGGSPDRYDAAEQELRAALVVQPASALSYIIHAAELDAKTEDIGGAVERLRLAVNVLSDEGQAQPPWIQTILNNYADRLLHEIRTRKQLSGIDGVHRSTDALTEMALFALDNAIKRQPTSPLLNVTKAQILFGSGAYEDVREIAARAIAALHDQYDRLSPVDRLKPDEGRNNLLRLAYALKGKAEASLGRHEVAEEDLFEALRLQNENFAFYSHEEGIEDVRILLEFLGSSQGRVDELDSAVARDLSPIKDLAY